MPPDVGLRPARFVATELENAINREWTHIVNSVAGDPSIA
jgi:hypothetical protein